MESDAPLPTDLHAIEVGAHPLPDDFRGKLLEIIDRSANDSVAQKFLADVAKAIDFCRVVSEYALRATSERPAHKELARLRDTLRTILKTFDALSDEAWGLLAIALQATGGPTPDFPASERDGDTPPRISGTSESKAYRRWVTHAAAPTVHATEGAKNLLKLLDTLAANHKPTSGRPIAAAPRLLANELVRLLRTVSPDESTTYEQGVFARVYRACYSEAFGIVIDKDHEGNLRRYLRDAIAATKPPKEIP